MVRITLLLLIMPFNLFKEFQVMIFQELMKPFYAEFLLLHSRRKLENGAETSQLHQSTAGTNSPRFSFLNLIVMTMTRYTMKLTISGEKDESIRDFNMRFHLDCLKYDLESELIEE